MAKLISYVHWNNAVRASVSEEIQDRLIGDSFVRSVKKSFKLSGLDHVDFLRKVQNGELRGKKIVLKNLFSEDLDLHHLIVQFIRSYGIAVEDVNLGG